MLPLAETACIVSSAATPATSGSHVVLLRSNGACARQREDGVACSGRPRSSNHERGLAAFAPWLQMQAVRGGPAGT